MMTMTDDFAPITSLPIPNYPDAGYDRGSLSRTVALQNGKGGVGKSSLACNIAGLVAGTGARVLLVDTDDQSNCADLLGVGDQADDGASLANHFMGLSDEPLLRIPARDNLDLVPGGILLDAIDLARWERVHQRPANPYELLIPALLAIESDYDLILLDTPPGESIALTAVLGLARWLIIPTRDDWMSIRGLGVVMDRLDRARRYNPALEVMGAVITQMQVQATRMRAETRADLVEVVGEDVLFDSILRHSAQPARLASNTGRLIHELAEEAEGVNVFSYLKEGKTIPQHAANASGLAGDYIAITDEVLRRLYDREEQQA